MDCQIIRFPSPQAEEMDISVSELAKMARREGALIEECGDLLSKTSISQVHVLHIYIYIYILLEYIGFLGTRFFPMEFRTQLILTCPRKSNVIILLT